MLPFLVIGLPALVAALLLSGCGIEPEKVGDPDALRQLQGQRVGLVVRVSRYLYGFPDLEPGEAPSVVRENPRGPQAAHDIPLITYGLAAHDSDNFKEALSNAFEVVLLGEYIPTDDENALNFDGELVLVNPSSRKIQVPFDEDTKSLVKEESLQGIIFIDQDWYIVAGQLTLGCYSRVTIVDASGTTIFQREPGSNRDGQAQYGSHLKDIVHKTTWGLLGGLTSEEIDQAVNEASSEAAEAVRLAIETYLSEE